MFVGEREAGRCRRRGGFLDVVLSSDMDAGAGDEGFVCCGSDRALREDEGCCVSFVMLDINQVVL